MLELVQINYSLSSKEQKETDGIDKNTLLDIYSNFCHFPFLSPGNSLCGQG